MKYVKIPETALERLIEGLENAIKVCYTALDNPEQGYPYAVGYSRGAMQMISDQLKTLKVQGY